MSSDVLTIDLPQLNQKLEEIETDLILVVTEPHVWELYKSEVNLENVQGKKTILFKTPRGESAKNITEYNSALEFFLSKEIHRRAHLLAFGGGALSDLAGFVAATLLRGLSWSVIPTTLLSMVDASIGGKVGINSREAKNQIGAFHAPSQVFLCQEFLASLSDEERWSGFGEIIKYCFLDKNVFHLVENKKPLREIVEACAKFKKRITEEDFQDKDTRKILNLGHSFGHALEKIYPLSHGIAVYWGMALILKLYGGENLLESLKRLGVLLELPHDKAPWYGRAFPIPKILELIRRDKKISSRNEIELVLVEEIGVIVKKTVNLDSLETLLEEKSHELGCFTL